MSMPMVTLNQVLLVAIGGAVGACLRYLLSAFLTNISPTFPLGTLAVNLIGAFFAGILFVWIWHKGLSGSPLQFILMVGMLGGLTTFSAFSLDTYKLLEAGYWYSALGNVLANVFGSLIAVFAGASTMKYFINS